MAIIDYTTKKVTQKHKNFQKRPPLIFEQKKYFSTLLLMLINRIYFFGNTCVFEIYTLNKWIPG